MNTFVDFLSSESLSSQVKRTKMNLKENLQLTLLIATIFTLVFSANYFRTGNEYGQSDKDMQFAQNLTSISDLK